jgi:putative transposase
MKRKTYKFRIYPNRNQETALIFTLNTCRHLYNAALAKRKHEGDINRLYREFDIFPWGKLQIQNMVKNKHLAKSISDAGWYQLMEMTKFKAEWAGKVVSLVDAHNTTQLCSRCGEMVKKSLAVRVHNCPVCGLILDRDHNAAINILNKVGQGLPELTPVEMFVRTSAKQEAPSEREG